MAGRSHVLVPSAGTVKLATYQYTDGANVKDDEITILGEQHLPSYSLEGGALANTTTISKHLFQIMAGAGLNVYVRWMGLFATTLAGAATRVDMQIRRLTTAGSGGTAGAFNALDSTDAAAGATQMIMPTALGTEGVTLWSPSMIVPAAVPATPHPDGFLIWQWPPRELIRVKSIRIPLGVANGICLKNNTALATATYAVVALISEAPY